VLERHLLDPAVGFDGGHRRVGRRLLAGVTRPKNIMISVSTMLTTIDVASGK
jgi:hypothetical protein